MTPFAHGTPIFRTDEIRRIEALAASRSDPPPLMERAGRAAAELARDLAEGNGKRIVVLAGPGNNGGDAFVVARHLKRWWFDVMLMFTGDAHKLSSDAAAALAAWRDTGGELAADVPGKPDCALVIDGLFGIGLQRPLEGRYSHLVSWMNCAQAPVLALDVPSGIESDSGRVLGCAVRATHTMTFIGLKPGLLTLDGPDHCGSLHVAALGLDAAAMVTPQGSVIGPSAIGLALPPRAINTHKGSYGSVGIVGGATGMAGAAILAGRAALKLGAGRVYVGFLDDSAPPVDIQHPELMLRRADEVVALGHLTCLAAGPGLGQSEGARTVLHSALAARQPLVLDADALNLVAADEGLRNALVERTAPTLLSPHPAEAARLLEASTADVQRDRVASAVKIAKSYRCSVVLKGAGSVCAHADGRWTINTSGNPGMASAGMGDVLTGVLAALLAQGAAPLGALDAGVHLHGAAADALVVEGKGPAGLTASETIAAARELMNRRRGV